MLSPHYDAKVYESLGDIVYVDNLIAYEKIKPLGEIILKHGYGDVVTVIKAHRHFDLFDCEAMLEEDKSDGSLGSLSSPVSLDQIIEMGASPNVIALGDGEQQGHCWFPVSYGLHVESVGAWNDVGFLREVSAYLADNSLTKLLMLGTARRTTKDSGGQIFLERNYDDCRTSELSIMVDVKQPDVITTTYTFIWVPGPDGTFVVDAQACSTCTKQKNSNIHANETHKSQTEQ